jgi:hypothetical protein
MIPPVLVLSELANVDTSCQNEKSDESKATKNSSPITSFALDTSPTISTEQPLSVAPSACSLPLQPSETPELLLRSISAVTVTHEQSTCKQDAREDISSCQDIQANVVNQLSSTAEPLCPSSNHDCLDRIVEWQEVLSSPSDDLAPDSSSAVCSATGNDEDAFLKESKDQFSIKFWEHLEETSLESTNGILDEMESDVNLTARLALSPPLPEGSVSHHHMELKLHVNHLRIVQSHQIIKPKAGDNPLMTHQWSISLVSVQSLPPYAIDPLERMVEFVEYRLHPTFSPNTYVVTQPPFALPYLVGWGEFEVVCVITLTRATLSATEDQALTQPIVARHFLDFNRDRSETIVMLPGFARPLQNLDDTQPVPCKFSVSGCQVNLPPKALYKHESKCAFRSSICLNCQLHYLKRDLATHLEKCEKAVSCPNHCGRSIVQSMLHIHLEECALKDFVQSDSAAPKFPNIPSIPCAPGSALWAITRPISAFNYAAALHVTDSTPRSTLNSLLLVRIQDPVITSTPVAPQKSRLHWQRQLPKDLEDLRDVFHLDDMRCYFPIVPSNLSSP